MTVYSIIGNALVSDSKHVNLVDWNNVLTPKSCNFVKCIMHVLLCMFELAAIFRLRGRVFILCFPGPRQILLWWPLVSNPLLIYVKAFFWSRLTTEGSRWDVGRRAGGKGGMSRLAQGLHAAHDIKKNQLLHTCLLFSSLFALNLSSIRNC